MLFSFDLPRFVRRFSISLVKASVEESSQVLETFQLFQPGSKLMLRPIGLPRRTAPTYLLSSLMDVSWFLLMTGQWV